MESNDFSSPRLKLMLIKNVNFKDELLQQNASIDWTNKVIENFIIPRRPNATYSNSPSHDMVRIGITRPSKSVTGDQHKTKIPHTPYPPR